MSIVGLDKVIKGYSDIAKDLNGPVYDEASTELEKDIEKSGRGWSTARVKNAVTTITDKKGITVTFVSTSAKGTLDPLGQHFVKVITSNIDKYVKEIEDSVGEAYG
jgi:hypothetical protein